MRSAAVFAVAVAGVVSRFPTLGEAVRIRGWSSMASDKPAGVAFVEAGARFGQEYEEIDVHTGLDGSFFLSINGAAAPDREPEVPEEVPETPEQVPEVPEQVPETPEQVPETPEQVPETPEQVPETPEQVPEEQVPETPEQVPEVPEPEPEEHEPSQPEAPVFETVTLPPRSEETDQRYVCIRRGYASAAWATTEQQNVTLDACMRACQAEDSCTHYTFDAETKHCKLQSGEPVFQETAHVVTGARTCDDSCYQRNVDYAGAPDVGSPINTPFVVDCQVACTASSICAAFVYKTAENTCHFKGPGYEVHRAEANGTVVGKKRFCV
ncbi:hypothetical protein NCLIV_041730 [Neospora caninum Liverpool]|uniref:Apple domain-containing protein n=1 Tax=Neospora caninum (strain Liverpool) TaxID=572307 RepID=F0VBW4_NEOCL|nr:hypothetical protein NCLIV_041730 [Neospora caninum Liverpool]CBZ51098.1 hypothetical protein NCLIV_041730 [Neospora caninum Liverpool]CEL68405.1 TPA: hypothetical protein BN1204_041730 [Neospora caninum Liverpool]|eukprot:XP_003881131.1 hypothetical protein NCLIV_041730 [Neospora caninum Liverpool]